MTTELKWALAAAAIATCYIVVQSRRHFSDHNGSPVLLDSNLDSATRKAVLAALAMETDSAVLHSFAAKLSAAGHPLSAEVLLAKTSSLPSLPSPHLAGWGPTMTSSSPFSAGWGG